MAACVLQVGDYVDTLLLPSSGMKTATVRWIPGPVEITGTDTCFYCKHPDHIIFYPCFIDCCVSAIGSCFKLV